MGDRSRIYFKIIIKHFTYECPMFCSTHIFFTQLANREDDTFSFSSIRFLLQKSLFSCNLENFHAIDLSAFMMEWIQGKCKDTKKWKVKLKLCVGSNHLSICWKAKRKNIKVFFIIVRTIAKGGVHYLYVAFLIYTFCSKNTSYLLCSAKITFQVQLRR